MRKDMLASFAVVAIVAIATLAWIAPWGKPEAPDVALHELDGPNSRLSDFRGRPVLLQFWATTCITCVAEMPHLVDLHESLGPRGLELVGVAMDYDPTDQVRSMVAEKQLPYRIVLDRDGAIAQAFDDVRLTPTTVLISPDGRVDWRRMGEIDFTALSERIEAMIDAGEA